MVAARILSWAFALIRPFACDRPGVLSLLLILMGTTVAQAPPGATLTATNGAEVLQFVNDPIIGWTIRDVYADPATNSMAITNEQSGVALWELNFLDSAGGGVSIGPGEDLIPLGGGTKNQTSGPAGPGAWFMTWSIAFSSSPVASARTRIALDVLRIDVTVFVAANPSGGFDLLCGYSVVPRTSVAVESLAFPRLSVRPTTGSKRDKLFVPEGEGALISDFGDRSFRYSADRRDHHQTLQVWATYSTIGSTPITEVDHDVSGSEAVYWGSRDSSGWSRGARLIDNPGSAVERIWEGLSFSERNIQQKSSPFNYAHYDLFSGAGFVWHIGAMPRGSDWVDVIDRYRDWARTVQWSYQGEVPYSVAGFGEQGSLISPRIAQSGLALIYEPYPSPTSTPVGCRSFDGLIAPDVAAWDDLFNQTAGVSSGSDGIVTLSYAHVNSPNFFAGAMDKYVNGSNPALLTSRAEPSFAQEIRAHNGLSDRSDALYVTGEWWDSTSGSWGGIPSSHPLSGATGPCASLFTLQAGSCNFASPPPLAKVPGLAYSYQAVSNPLGSLSCRVYGCADNLVMCPGSSAVYQLSYEGAIAALVNGYANLSVPVDIEGVYLDSMMFPFNPLCHYEPTTADPDDLPHLHAPGGGQYWIAGRRLLTARARAAVRSVNPDGFVLAEYPAEFWVGVADARGSSLVPASPNPGTVTGLYDSKERGVDPPSAISSYRSTAVPAFNYVYGNAIGSYDADHRESPERRCFLARPFGSIPAGCARSSHRWDFVCLPAPLQGPPSLPAPTPGTPHPVSSPGLASQFGLYLHNAYSLEMSGNSSVPVNTVPSIVGTTNDAAVSWRDGVIRDCAGERMYGAGQTGWDDLLWHSFVTGMAWPCAEFHFGVSMQSFKWRDHNLYPYHANLDPRLSGQALVADDPTYRMMRALHKIRDLWGDWVTRGRLLRAPIVEPVGWSPREVEFYDRVCPEMRGHVTASMRAPSAGGPLPTAEIVIVTNWLPWTLQFEVSVRNVDLQLLPGTTPVVEEFAPFINGPGQSVPIAITPVAPRPFLGHTTFVTSPIPPGEARVYRIQ